MDWKVGSSGRVPALQVHSPEFNKKKKKKKKKKGRRVFLVVVV
jgi:hypothetical protein